MDNKNYVVNRDDIYVGEVANVDCDDSVYRYTEKTAIFGEIPGQFGVSSWRHYRSMLFIPDEQKLASDLLYKSPAYPILNISDNQLFKNHNQRLTIIKDQINLADLLSYLKYEQELTLADLINIRKQIFNGHFAMDNCELFGYSEMQPEDWTYYENGQPVTNPRRLKARIRKAKADQVDGHRMFGSTEGGILPSKYFRDIDSMGDNTLADIMRGFDDQINAFKPNKAEGPIKKLVPFGRY